MHDVGSDAGTVPVLKYLSVAAVTGGDIMSLQESCCSRVPATTGQLLQHVQAGTVVLSSKHLRDAVFGAMASMLIQGFAADLQ
jgi:hypothetical protein